MLTRRTLLLAAATLATPYINTASARTPTVAHVRTGVDYSHSKKYRQAATLNAMAHVVRKNLPDIIESSGFDVVMFDAYLWSHITSPLLPLTALPRGACTSECDQLADILDLAAANPFTYGSTELTVALSEGLRSFAPRARRKVLNIETDDSDARSTAAYLFAPYLRQAETEGVIINGLITGDPHAMNDYFAQSIQRGPGSFTLKSADFASMRDVWEKKFHLDMT